MKSVGPCVPSAYLDNRLEKDESYGVGLFSSDASDATAEWLNSKPATSVVYVSFGSIVNLGENQVLHQFPMHPSTNPFIFNKFMPLFTSYIIENFEPLPMLK